MLEEKRTKMHIGLLVAPDDGCRAAGNRAGDKTIASDELVPVTTDAIQPLFQRAISNVREEMLDSPYIAEAMRVLKVRVIVIWDAWQDVPLQQHSATILRAYELAEGPESRDRIALASGLTVPEAHAAGMLPYQIITALRKGDPVTHDQAQQAMLDEGGSLLFHPLSVQLRFATGEEAEAARQRLIQRFPGSEDVWIIDREITAQDLAAVQGWAQG